jgi:hypothetical protein
MAGVVGGAFFLCTFLKMVSIQTHAHSESRRDPTLPTTYIPSFITLCVYVYFGSWFFLQKEVQRPSPEHAWPGVRARRLLIREVADQLVVCLSTTAGGASRTQGRYATNETRTTGLRTCVRSLFLPLSWIQILSWIEM